MSVRATVHGVGMLALGRLEGLDVAEARDRALARHMDSRLGGVIDGPGR